MRSTVFLALCILAGGISGADDSLTFPSDTPLAADTAAGWKACYDGGRMAEAGTLFAKALAADPKDVPAAVGLMVVQSGAGEYRLAYETGIAALGAGGSSPWTECLAADTLALQSWSVTGRELPAALEQAASVTARPRIQQLFLRTMAAQAHAASGAPKDAAAIQARLPWLRDWLVCGPFNNREKAGFDRDDAIAAALPALALDTPAPGRNGTIAWTPIKRLPENGVIDLSVLHHPGTENIAWLAATLESPSEMTATLILGLGGRATVYANGVRIAQWTQYGQRHHPFQRVLACPLAKGANRIAIKIGGDRSSEGRLSAMLVPLSPAELDAPGALPDASWAALPPQTPVQKAKTADTADNEMAGCHWGLAELLRQREASLPGAAFSLGVVFLERGLNDDQFNLSRPLFEQAAKLNPRCPLFLSAASIVQHDMNESMRLLDAARALAPDLVDVRELKARLAAVNGLPRIARDEIAAMKDRPTANLLEIEATLLFREKAEPEAAACIRRALAIAPGCNRLYPLAAQCTADREAALALEKTGTLRCGDEKLALAYARRLLQHPASAREAEAFAREHILAANPWNVGAWMLVKDARLTATDANGAVAAIGEALAWMPTQPVLLDEAGRLALMQSEPEKAIAAWSSLLAAAPDSTAVREKLKQIQPEEKTFHAAYAVEPSVFLKDKPKAADFPGHTTAMLLDQGMVYQLPNGGKASMCHFARMALTDDGVKELGGHAIPYDPATERITVLIARLHQPDGTTTPAAGINDRTQGGGGGGEGKIYNGSFSVKEIRFTGAREGSVMEIQYVEEPISESAYGNLFEDLFFLGGTDPTMHFQYIVDTLADRHVDVKTYRVGDSATFSERTENGRHVREWSAKSIPGIVEEPGMPPMAEIAPSFHVSSFASWDEAGRWFWDLARDSMRMSEEMRATAREITANAKTPEEKIAAVYYAVAEQIRYVGIELGRNGYVPHSVERTWKGRYGDCKDTALLMAALLREVGVEATVALVRTRHLGAEMTSCPGVRGFNHAICYVPPVNGRDYWLDGTTDFFHLTEVPPADQGTVALVTAETGGKLMTIPEDDPFTVGELVESEATLDATGGGTLTATVRVTGLQAAMHRQIFAAPEQFRKMLEMYCKRRFPNSNLTAFETSGSDLKNPDVWFRITVQSPSLARRNGGTLAFRPTLFPRNPARQMASQNKREHDLRLPFTSSSRSKLKLTLPAGATVQTPLEAIEKEVPQGVLKRATAIDGQTVTVTTQFTVREWKIPQAAYQEFRAFCAAAEKAEEDQIIITLPSGPQPPAQ